MTRGKKIKFMKLLSFTFLLAIRKMTVAMDKLIQKYENWLHLTILIHFSGRNLCHNVLFVQEELPADGKLLYKEMESKCSV